MSSDGESQPPSTAASGKSSNLKSIYSAKSKGKAVQGSGSMMRELLNKLSDREREVEELRKENRTLQTIQRRQEKALGKHDSQDEELPALLARKDNEIAVFAKQAKLYKDKWYNLDKDLKKYQKQLQDYKDKNDELTKLVAQKGLHERARLQEELEEYKAMLEARDGQIAKLEKMVELAEKANARSQHHQLKNEYSAGEEVQNLRNTVEFLRGKLSEKEKLLDSLNIRHHHFGKGAELSQSSVKMQHAPSTTPAVQPTPFKSAKDQAKEKVTSPTPAHHAPTPAFRESASPTKLSGFKEQKEQKEQRGEKDQLTHPYTTAAQSRMSPMHGQADNSTHQNVLQLERETAALTEAVRRAELEARHALQKEEETRYTRQQQQQQQQEQEEESRVDRQRREDEERRREEEKREDERRQREKEEQRREEEQRIAREREDEARMQRLRQDEDARLAAQRDEQARQEALRAEEEQRARDQEIARAAIEKAKEERRKKDALLAKLKDMDQGAPPGAISSPIVEAPVVAAAPISKKNLPTWLQSEPAAPEPSTSTASGKSDPYENMHKGLPARPDLLGSASKAGRTQPAQPQNAASLFLSDGPDVGRRRRQTDDQSSLLDGPPRGGAPAASKPKATAAFPWETKTTSVSSDPFADVKPAKVSAPKSNSKKAFSAFGDDDDGLDTMVI